MTIEIHKPELEALILERMGEGAFQSVEDVLLHALRSSPPPSEPCLESSTGAPGRTGAELVAAMQASPYKEVDLSPGRYALPVRDVAL